MIEACQVSENILNSMSTKGLIKTCLDHPFFGDILISQNLDYSFENMVRNYNVFGELVKRNDVGKLLMAEYIEMEPEEFANKTIDNFNESKYRFMFVEFLFGNEIIINSLSKEEQKELIKEMLIKTDKKIKTKKFKQKHIMTSSWVILRLLRSIDLSSYELLAEGNNELQNFYKSGISYNKNEINNILTEAVKLAEMENQLKIVIQPPPDPPTPKTIYTPKGTAVQALIIHDEWFDIDGENAYYDNLLPNAERISDATKKYNCHSYALHRTEGYWFDIVWVSDPTAYYTDGSYIQTDIGDAVNYKVKYTQYVVGQEDRITHTANKSTTPGKYISKWGGFALYKHNLTYVPPDYLNSFLPLKYIKSYVSTEIKGREDVAINKYFDYYVEDITGASYTWTTSSTIQKVYSNGNHLRIKPVSQDWGNEWIKVKIKTEVGNSEYDATRIKNLRIYYENIPGPGLKAYNINISPNPASEVVNVSFVEIDEYENSENKKLDYEIYLFDRQNNLVSKEESNKKNVQLKVKDLKKDRYFIQIVQGEDKFTEQIIVH